MREGKKFLVDGYPFTFKHRRSTLHLKAPASTAMVTAFEQLLGQNRPSNRASAPLQGVENTLFAKHQVLENLQKKLRFTRGLRKRCGMFDWPIEELINTTEAHRRGVRVPGVIAYGYTRSRLGLMNDFFIITELLQGYTDGYRWTLTFPGDVEKVITAAFELMLSLNNSGIYHMDLWAANMMMCECSTAPTYAIDLENSFAQKTYFLDETLGFQFGFFYLREIYRFITEAQYDTMVYKALEAYEGVDYKRFSQVYEVSKHRDIGRKERREIFLRGAVKF